MDSEQSLFSIAVRTGVCREGTGGGGSAIFDRFDAMWFLLFKYRAVEVRSYSQPSGLHDGMDGIVDGY